MAELRCKLQERTSQYVIKSFLGWFLLRIKDFLR